jgi:UDP-N-acetylglucosamine 4,6-dehydratase
MAMKYTNDPRVKFVIGDVRDKDRLERTLDGVDFVVHAAATKIVPTAEYNPFECVKTNVNGAMNVIDACLQQKVKRVVALSTDKASNPINLYGATKLTSDKLFVAANNIRGKHNIKFSVVRYGNVMGSRGSIIPLFQELASKGLPIPVTDLRMTRFWITLDQAVKFVDETFSVMNGGELFVPRIPSMKITDLVAAIAPNSKIEEIGIRPGEKLHEEMISADDSRRTVMQKTKFILSLTSSESAYVEPKGDKLPEGFSYKSDTNDQWLTQREIKDFIKKN